MHSLRMDHLDLVGRFWSRMSIAGTEVVINSIECVFHDCFLFNKSLLGLDFNTLCFSFVEANVIYLESPIGVGFSYSIDTSSYEGVNDKITGRAHLPI